MIGGRVRVSIYGQIRENLYSGYATNDQLNNESCYLISKREQHNLVRGVIIAVVNLKNMGEKLIVAPEHEYFYEPEIMEILSKLKSIEIESISCLYEKSCGAIILYKERENRYKVLLVRNNNGKNYSFPKGHIEKGENEKETAIREIKEETGLDVRIVDNFREVSDYTPYGKIKKRVVFFMAQAFTDKVDIQREELDSFKWVDLNVVDRICTYDNDLRVINHARKNLHKLK